MKQEQARDLQQKKQPKVSPFLVLLKALMLFVILNLLFALIDPNAGIFLLYGKRKLSRFPQMWVPTVHNDGSVSYDRLLSSNMDLLFASHRYTRAKQPGEFRVAIFGDSATWGTALHTYETMAEQVTALNLKTCDGRRIVAYNLGFPNNSVTKDLLIMEYAQDYDPDLSVWLFSMLAFHKASQVFSFTEENAAGVQELNQSHGYDFDMNQVPAPADTLLDRTIVGQRQTINLAFNLSASNLLVRTLGVDDPRVWEQHDMYVPTYARQMDTFLGATQEQDIREYLQVKALWTANSITAGNIIYVNEPIQVGIDGNPEYSYNEFYPRWAYDRYRDYLAQVSSDYGWYFLDLWNMLPENLFTTSIFHIGSEGELILANVVGSAIRDWSCQE